MVLLLVIIVLAKVKQLFPCTMSKRSFSESDEPELKRQRAASATNWKKVELEDLSGSFEPSKGKFGGYLGKFDYDFMPFTFTTPFLTIAHDPSAWDDEKNERFGKKGEDGKPTPLDPNRKHDKWNVPLEVTDEFHVWLERDLQARMAELLFENRTKVKVPFVERAKDSSQLAFVFEALVKQEKSGKFVWSLDARSEKGQKSFPVKVKDFNTGAEISEPVGQGSVVAAVVSASSCYINKSVKVYFTPQVIYVKKLVPPRSAMSFDADFDEDLAVDQ